MFGRSSQLTLSYNPGTALYTHLVYIKFLDSKHCSIIYAQTSKLIWKKSGGWTELNSGKRRKLYRSLEKLQLLWDVSILSGRHRWVHKLGKDSVLSISAVVLTHQCITIFGRQWFRVRICNWFIKIELESVKAASSWNPEIYACNQTPTKSKQKNVDIAST